MKRKNIAKNNQAPTWYKLDLSAIVYPTLQRKDFSSVYRLSVSLKEEIDPNILVEQAAGITNGKQVYDFIMAGSEAAGAASGIMNAADPIAMIDEMIGAVRQAADDLAKINK